MLLHPYIEDSIEAIVFDLDGTLLDSMPYWVGLGERYLQSLGHVAHSDAREHFNVHTLEGSACYIKETYGVDKEIPEIMEGILAGIEKAYVDEIPLKPYAQSFLEKCHIHDVACVIATASERRLFEPALNRLGVDDYFSGLFVCSEIGASKTHPDVFYEAQKFLDIQPQKILVIDDSLHAIKTAQQAGFQTLAMLDAAGASSHDALKALAHGYINSFAELI